MKRATGVAAHGRHRRRWRLPGVVFGELYRNHLIAIGQDGNAGWRLAAKLFCKVNEVPRDEPIGGCGLGAMPWPAFVGARNESGLKSLLVCALYVVNVASDEHQLIWSQCQIFGRAEISAGIGFVGRKHLHRQKQVEPQTGGFHGAGHCRDIDICQHRERVALRQPFQALGNVRPRAALFFPGQRERVDVVAAVIRQTV
jgi:hypothetical protein